MKTGIIGGGASGMMAAFFSAKNSDTTLFEKNEKLGKKIYITGKGRCNVCNDCSCEEFLENVVTNSKFLYSAIYSFTPKDTMKFFEDLGLHLKTERGNRVFPMSDKSSDVINTLSKAIIKSGVDLKLEEEVISIEKHEKFHVKTSKNNYIFDKIIIATGGLTYSTTGSSGDGYDFANRLGHDIKKIKPALVPLTLDEDFLKQVVGLSLYNVRLTSYKKNKKYKSFFGDLMFTPYGISGPISLTMSSYINKLNTKEISLYLDLKPALDIEKLDKRFVREFETNQNKNLSNVMENLLPKSLVFGFLSKTNLKGDEKCHSINAAQRRELVEKLKKFPLNYKGTFSLDLGIITNGGVNVKEIDPSTMQSKLIKNLYFAGEVIDVDALTGGFNLQIAFSTAYLAGNSVK